MPKPNKNNDLYLQEALHESKTSPGAFCSKNTYPDVVEVMQHNQKSDIMKKSLKNRHLTQSYGQTKINPPAPEQEEPYHLASDEDGCELVVEDAVPSCGKWNLPRSHDKSLMANTAHPAPPASPEDNYILKDEITFERIAEQIAVSVVAINEKNLEANHPMSIPADGDPLGGYAYTPESDQFVVVCQDYAPLGVIPMAFRLVVKGYLGKMAVPLPEGLIMRHATPSQKKILKAFKEKYADCVFEFVQALYRG